MTLALFISATGCEEAELEPLACDSEPVVRTAAEGVEFVRTPDACFEGLPDWNYEPQYLDIDGLRQAYVDEGPADGPVVLLLHGQPSWSYLYRKMIPVLADAGFRVIAMDHLGTGRSDKPTDIASYSYLGHNERLERFIEGLGLRDIHLFVQDWGSLIGLRVAGLHPEWFAAIAVGDGALPRLPAGVEAFPPVESPNEIVDLEPLFADLPAQQIPVYDGCEPRGAQPHDAYFGRWMEYAMKARSFRASEVVEAMTWFDLPAEEEAAYDAPFPSRTYMAGIRKFPSLINEVPGTTDEAWEGLESFERPFLTVWAGNDPGGLGSCDAQEYFTTQIPGANGWPHTRLPEASHFLQDDQGPTIARILTGFFGEQITPLTRGSRYCEVLLVRNEAGSINAEVWGTQNVSDCPEDAWDALEPDALQAETGALAVLMNGPRLWMTDSVGASGESEREQTTYGDLRMNLLASLELAPGMTESTPYIPLTVNRRTTFVFQAGREVYEVVDADGAVYVMQSLALTIDSEQDLADLPRLGSRLELPEGWTFGARVLEEPLVMRAQGQAVIVTDDLQNTYQRRSGEDKGGALSLLADGTGTPCESDDECSGLEASHCLSAAEGGFCTVQACEPTGCGEPYLCCHSCAPAAAGLLPFDGSACLPSAISTQLVSQAGCTCE